MPVDHMHLCTGRSEREGTKGREKRAQTACGWDITTDGKHKNLHLPWHPKP